MQESRMASRRNVGVALDFSPSSKNALDWAIKNLLRDGDSVVLVIVRPKACEPAPHVKVLWAESGSPLISLLEYKDPKVQNDYGVQDDPDVMNMLNDLNLHKDVCIQFKIYWGDPNEKICEAITKIPLDTIVMGNRGLGTIQRMLLGSVSKYVVNNAQCPITIVKQ